MKFTVQHPPVLKRVMKIGYRQCIKLFGRNQRRYGGYLVHLGIVVIGIGVVGSTMFQYETRRTIVRWVRVSLCGNYVLAL